MDLNIIERHWADLQDAILRKFPQLEQEALGAFDGRISAFVEYLARAHDLTRQEAVATLEDRLLVPAEAFGEAPRMAAE